MMEILTEITKERFEKFVPVAKMPERNTSVYTRVKEMFVLSYRDLIEQIVSPGCESAIDGNEMLKHDCVRWVCLDAFIRTCRSLDLVLTATGFGIVSTDSTAPASRARVDALVEEMSVERIRRKDDIIITMKDISGWSETRQAKGCIQTLFYNHLALIRKTSLQLTTENWQKALGRAITADTMLRKEISHEYMDDLLQKTRSNSLSADDYKVVKYCLNFMGDFISQPNTPIPNRDMLENIVYLLECKPSLYPAYQQSKLYTARHADRYQNRKEDPTFFFV